MREEEKIMWRTEFLGDFYTILWNAKERTACAEVTSAEVHRIPCPPGSWNLSQYSQTGRVCWNLASNLSPLDRWFPHRSALSKNLFCFVNCIVELLEAWPETSELYALKIWKDKHFNYLHFPLLFMDLTTHMPNKFQIICSSDRHNV